MRALKAGIFAAGVGARMRAGDGGPHQPKALTRVGDRTLIEWILRDIEAAGAGEIVVIVNEQSIAVRDHVTRVMPSRPITWIVETTPSSMHSFLRVLETLAGDGGDGPFLMSTVDTIAPPGTFARFVGAASRARAADIVLALTPRVEDDHPLRMQLGSVDADGSAGIMLVGEGAHATAGYSFVRATLLREADAARRANLPALRAFLRHVCERGCTMRGICMPDSIDVDRPSDVAAAEQLLRSCGAGAA
jgi:NDP-sugar pyrophosphorylase family protein